MSYQKVIIAGNVGNDPEMRFTPSGVGVTNFSVATNRQYTNSTGAKVKETVWFRISAWGKLAEICQQYVEKGSKVLVEGMLQADDAGNPRTFQRKDGSTGASFELRADQVRFMGGKSDGQTYRSEEAVEEELPF